MSALEKNNQNQDDNGKLPVELTSGEMKSFGLSGEVEEMFTADQLTDESAEQELKNLRIKAKQKKKLQKETETEIKSAPQQKLVVSITEVSKLEKVPAEEIQQSESSKEIQTEKGKMKDLLGKVPEQYEYHSRVEFYEQLNYPLLSYRELFKKLKGQ